MPHRRLSVLLLFLLSLACRKSGERLDEAMLHSSPALQIKIVRYYENLPLHYKGEVFRVFCSSPATAGIPAGKMQEPGAKMIGNGGAIGTRHASDLLARERKNYDVIGDQIVIWRSLPLNISFDACGSFRTWNPTSLPATMIDPAPKPSYCAPVGTADCRHYDFMGDRMPRYEDIRADTQAGTISFIARSRAIRGTGHVRVTSTDSGRTWSVQ